MANWRQARRSCCQNPMPRIVIAGPTKAPMSRKRKCRPISIGSSASPSNSAATAPTASSSSELFRPALSRYEHVAVAKLLHQLRRLAEICRQHVGGIARDPLRQVDAFINPAVEADQDSRGG